MSYTVYMHENKLNGKKYIGITSTKPERRWQNGNGYKTQLLFSRAIKKYGWDEFNHYILFTNLTKESAKKKEIKLIEKYQTTNKKYGYNMSKGGEIPVGYERTEELNKHMSEIKKGHKYNLGKHHAKETIAKMSKPIICVETGVVYIGMREAERITGIKSQHIYRCCKGMRKHTGGYSWRYYEEKTQAI